MLLDFAAEYANVSFEQESLCHLDLLVFTQLACFDFPASCIDLPLPQALVHAQLATVHLAGTPSVKLADSGETAEGARTSHSAPPICALHNKEDDDLARIVATASRYRNVFVRAFESEHSMGDAHTSRESSKESHNPHECKQFAGLALECDDAVIIIFRGTDATFLGWQETFNMAVTTPIPSQKHAALFLKRIANLTNPAFRKEPKTPEEEAASANSTAETTAPPTCAFPKPIVLCGHSKGGNLAVYAAATCADDIAARIAAVVSFDGPALPEPIMRAPGYSRTRDRITLYIPRASIVGLLFTRPERTEQPHFIASSKLSVMQHYPYFWKTRGTRLAPSTQSPKARIIANGVQGLINNLTAAQKQQIIATIFGILESSGARTFDELDSNRLQTAAATIRAFTQNGGKTRRLAAAILKTFAKSAFALQRRKS